jgi:hypothetical protein
MWTTPSLALIAGVFVLAGLVKGVVGFGLPVVAIAVLTAIHGLTEAMALMLVPTFVTNLWQALVGGRLGELTRRLWSFMAAICLFVWISSGLLASADARYLTAGLGTFLLIYALVSLMTPQVPPPGRREAWLAPLVGALNGTITGLTGTYVLPAGLYLQALGLGRDGLVQAMGIVFTLSTVVLGAALWGRSLISGDALILSGAATAPALLGLVAGQQVRKRVPEAMFRRTFFAALVMLAVYLIWRSA